MGGGKNDEECDVRKAAAERDENFHLVPLSSAILYDSREKRREFLRLSPSAQAVFFSASAFFSTITVGFSTFAMFSLTR
jgi:hypothetical protein